ncbi:MAG: DUF885 family protein [Clostridia bacterium]|nr:DUF885 family protein [Clostridia bacterium]
MNKKLTRLLAMLISIVMLLGVFSACGEQCDHDLNDDCLCSKCNKYIHDYENGVCTRCGALKNDPTQCAHTFDGTEPDNMVCTKCNTVCRHENITRGICPDCGIECKHKVGTAKAYVDGVCSVCGYQCPHKWDVYGVCSYCAYHCPHDWDENYRCTICGFTCPHYWNATTGTCDKCGKVCTHDWILGKCNICGMECDHQWNSGVCSVCKSTCPHDYSNQDGQCSICDMLANSTPSGDIYHAKDYYRATDSNTDYTVEYFNNAWYVDFTDGTTNSVEAVLKGDYSRYSSLTVVVSGLEGITIRVVPFGIESLAQTVALEGYYVDADDTEGTEWQPRRYRKEINFDISGDVLDSVDWTQDSFIYFYASGTESNTPPYDDLHDFILSDVMFDVDPVVAFTANQQLFEYWCDDQFIIETMTNTINIHYTLRNPEVYGIYHYPATMYSINLDELGMIDDEDGDGLDDGLEELIAEVTSFNRAELTADQQLVYDIMITYCENIQKTVGLDYIGSNFGMSGIQENMPTNLAEYKFYSEEDVIDYLELQRQLPQFFIDCVEYERIRAELGYALDDYSIDVTIDNCVDFLKAKTTELTPAGGDNYMLIMFESKINALKDLTRQEKDAYIAQNEADFLEYTVNAYQYVIDHLSEIYNIKTQYELDDDYNINNELGYAYLGFDWSQVRDTDEFAALTDADKGASMLNSLNAMSVADQRTALFSVLCKAEPYYSIPDADKSPIMLSVYNSLISTTSSDANKQIVYDIAIDIFSGMSQFSSITEAQENEYILAELNSYAANPKTALIVALFGAENNFNTLTDADKMTALRGVYLQLPDRLLSAPQVRYFASLTTSEKEAILLACENQLPLVVRSAPIHNYFYNVLASNEERALTLANNYNSAPAAITENLLRSVFSSLPESERRAMLKQTDGAQYYEYYMEYRSGIVGDRLPAIENPTITDMTVDEIFEWCVADAKSAIAEFKSIKDNSANSTAYQAWCDCVFMDENSVAGYGMTNPYAILELLKTMITEDFPELPPNNYTCEPVHPALQAINSAAAYYMIPQLDDFATNYIYYNQANVSAGSLFSTLAHEGYPGHLFQYVYYYNTNPHELRDVFRFTGYSEGWTKYIEGWVPDKWDFGALDAPITRLYQLWERIFYSIICVEDIGVNYFGWTAQDALDYIEDNFDAGNVLELDDGRTFTISSLYAWDGSIFEIVISAPGMYPAYSCGQIKVTELRAKAEEALGDLFVLKDFHVALLEVGPAQYIYVERAIDEYIAQVLADNP